MAHEKQGWKDALQAIQSERGRSHDTDHQRKKKSSRLMYRKRKLDKDVRNYINNTKIIKYSTINSIGIGHGFYFG